MTARSVEGGRGLKKARFTSTVRPPPNSALTTPFDSDYSIELIQQLTS